MINPLTNIRSGPGTNFQLLQLANKGDIFPIMKMQGDWFQIRLPDGKSGYVANWIVQSEEASKIEASSRKVLQGKTLVVDAGHGGEDGGAVGTRQGSLEKEVNLQVARIVKDKLEAAGAMVILTRQDDRRVTLKERVDISTKHGGCCIYQHSSQHE
jgi:N-acetylmuramoyl-L-alanine amidase